MPHPDKWARKRGTDHGLAGRAIEPDGPEMRQRARLIRPIVAVRGETRLDKIACVVAFREPLVDRQKYVARLATPILRAIPPGEAPCRPQFI